MSAFSQIDGVCLKVGIAYKADFVNNLYYQFKQHNPTGKFYCYTDNKNRIHEDIECVKINSRYDERMWWNKCLLFEPERFMNPTVFFDLDSFIHNPIQPLVDGSDEFKPNFLHTHWFSENMAKIIHQCDVNSSIMVLHKRNYEQLWEEYRKNEVKLFKSFYGIDSWVFRRHRENISFLPPKLVYSLKYGSAYPDDTTPDKVRDNHIVAVLDNVEDKEKVLKGLWPKDVPSST